MKYLFTFFIITHEITDERERKLYLKVMTALLIGHPMTKDVVGSSVTSDTSEIQLESQTSDRGTWNRMKSS